MAKNTKATAATDAAGTGTAVPGATPKSRGGRPPGPVFAWDDARDYIVITLLLSNPRVLSAAQVHGQLVQNPAFTSDAHLLTKEKIRQRINKLSAKTMKLYGVPLELRRTSNSGYDVDATIHKAFQAMGVQAQPQQAQAASTQEPAAAPVASAPAPVALPTLPSGFPGGGLIATPGAGGA